jgi:hypothetical protein
MKTLKDIISEEGVVVPMDALESVSRRLMCIVTAFELLSGQGASFSVSGVSLSDCHLRRSIGH